MDWKGAILQVRVEMKMDMLGITVLGYSKKGALVIMKSQVKDRGERLA